MNVTDPFDPIEATVARDDKAEWSAMAVAQGLVGHLSGQEAIASNREGKAAAIAGRGSDGKALGFGPETGQGQRERPVGKILEICEPDGDCTWRVAQARVWKA